MARRSLDLAHHSWAPLASSDAMPWTAGWIRGCESPRDYPAHFAEYAGVFWGPLLVRFPTGIRQYMWVPKLVSVRLSCLCQPLDLK